MSTTAQPNSQFTFGPANGGGDILHFENANNQIVGWVDAQGVFQGGGVGSGAATVTGAFTQGSSGQTVLNASGLLTNYDGLATAGLGVPPILAIANLSTQGFAVFNTSAAVNLLPAAAPAGTYRASIYLVLTTTFVTNTTVNIALGFTDDNGAQAPVTVSTSTLTAGTAVQISYTFRSTGATAITYKPGVTGPAATAGAASFSVVLERLI